MLALLTSCVRGIARCSAPLRRLYKVQTCAQGEPRLSSTEERALPVSRPVTSCALSSDCRQLLVSTASDEVELWDLRSTAADAEPIMRFVGQKQSRFVIRSAFGGHAERFVISGCAPDPPLPLHRCPPL